MLADTAPCFCLYVTGRGQMPGSRPGRLSSDGSEGTDHDGAPSPCWPDDTEPEEEEPPDPLECDGE